MRPKKKSKGKNLQHTTPAQKEKLAFGLMTNLEKQGKLNQEHGRAFNQLLDDAVLGIKNKK